MNASCDVGSDGKTCRRGTCLKRRYDLVKILLQQQRSPFCFPFLQFLLPDKKSHFRYFFVLLKLYQNVMECGCLGFMCKNVSWKCEKGLKIVDPMKTTSSSTYSNPYLVMHFFSTVVDLMEFNFWAELNVFLSKSRFLHESVVIFLHLSLPNLKNCQEAEILRKS